MKRKTPLKVWAHSKSLLLENIVPSVKKVLLAPFPPCVDENLMPLRAKSRIVVLGNHEDRTWSKSQRFAPVLRQDSLRFLTSLAVEHRCTLKQGDVKNAFCNSELPSDEVTIVRPPIGDPSAAKNEFWLLRKTLYGLRRSPKHWYDKINRILRAMGLQPNLYDPCLYSGFIKDPNDPSDTPSTIPFVLGLYVDDFVFFSPDKEQEAKFCRILADQIPVDFMGTVEWFLGIHFNWNVSDDEVEVHLNQSGFARNLVERFECETRDPTPTATPWRSGLPIDSIPSASIDDVSPAQKRRREAYQSLVGSIGWLANTTRPDLSPVHSFLSSYTMVPAAGHMKAALYCLHYINSTHDQGISFSSRDGQPVHTFLHHPDISDAEAFTDAVPPKLERRQHLTTYSDACWGSQLGSSVRDGTLLPLFKQRSMSGAIIFRMGGPIAWTCVRQERTSHSSCEAEIRATCEGSKLTMAIRNLAGDLRYAGIPVVDTSEPTTVYNDNESCVSWAHSLTTKAIRHMELRENSVREWVQDKCINVRHVKGTCNPSDIFTKEMKDGVHYRRLRNSFMSTAASFVQTALAAVFRRQASATI